MSSQNNPPIKLVAAWKRNDAQAIKDATDFWLNSRVLSREMIEQRLPELCSVAYVGEEVVAVSTIELRRSPLLRCRLGFFRCMVSPAFANRRMPRRLTVHARDQLQNWSKENPNEKVLGMAAILENPSFDNLAKRVIWRSRAFDIWLIGYTQQGQQIRLTWFDHARLD